MHIDIFTNGISIDLNHIKKQKICYKDLVLNDIKLILIEWNQKYTYYLANLVFPEKDNFTKNKFFESNSLVQSNVWLYLKNRPFTLCPIDYNKLLDVTNNSVLNICVFDTFNNLIGFAVLMEKSDFFWIEIICTKSNKGIGTIIIELIKSIVSSVFTNKYKDNNKLEQYKPIRLSSTFNAEKFYMKKGFKKLFGSIYQFSL
jgi:hypothetical protein